jgi:hypothetical protein
VGRRQAGPTRQPAFFLDPARAYPLLGRPMLPRSAQQACGPPYFFLENLFAFVLKSANFKLEYLSNYKPKLGETCTKNS